MFAQTMYNGRKDDEGRDRKGKMWNMTGIRTEYGLYKVVGILTQSVEQVQHGLLPDSSGK